MGGRNRHHTPQNNQRRRRRPLSEGSHEGRSLQEVNRFESRNLQGKINPKRRELLQDLGYVIRSEEVHTTGRGSIKVVKYSLDKV